MKTLKSVHKEWSESLSGDFYPLTAVDVDDVLYFAEEKQIKDVIVTDEEMRCIALYACANFACLSVVVDASPRNLWINRLFGVNFHKEA